jgi:two-component system response regulator HydG
MKPQTRQWDVLVVEDQPRERAALARLFRAEGWSVATASGVAEALAILKSEVGAVVCDLRLGRESAMEILDRFNASNRSIPFIIMTGYGDVPDAVAAIKRGAHDFLTKPVKPAELVASVRELLAEKSATAGQAKDSLLGSAPSHLAALDRARKAAATDATILLLGESGTGKELFAREIHDSSNRSAGPFLAVNVAAIPESLLEGELFGYEAGAFTGASTARAGWFESADGGTLFLDEIGDLPPSAQVKLLRVLESRSVTPLGSTASRPIDVRIVAATSRDLGAAIKSGGFREDLFYRLESVTIRLPPLRDRKEDVPSLAAAFAERAARSLGKTTPAIAPDFVAWAVEQPWPGNIRQLRNLVESMVLFANGPELSLANVPGGAVDQHGSSTEANVVHSPQLGSLAEGERAMIEDALRRHQGNRTRAAESLGISRRTLQRKLRLWGWPQTSELEDSDASL